MAAEIRELLADQKEKLVKQHRAELLAAEVKAYNQGHAHGMQAGFEIGVFQGESQLPVTRSVEP
jgi:flagellar biosynthesis/type III secretory pathway protein FliH